MMPGTCYVPDAYVTRYVLYCIAICVFERGWWYAWERERWYAWHLRFDQQPAVLLVGGGTHDTLRSAQEIAVSSRVPYEVPFRSRCTTKSIAKKSPTGSLPPAVPLAITPTFRPWTHTSDDSYIYQLSLVVATATVSFINTQVYTKYRSRVFYVLSLWRI